ncbi:OsmC family protein [Vibrio brasiliensis]|jgi:organic hydroperoxide reductase OsmC/OhrA|uniref:OsmC family protein n=1 Tax=Vibrio brasiliensis TaxID=170652 RepID=UPI001EFDD7E0|nr:OsmC family protein [Vibrio brasiliensis]MCG9750084.1 OsmC family protein [Vibrio brasiliensis]MCG9781986.1 OsmC family protein [Vibrio brasiliensis]
MSDYSATVKWQRGEQEPFSDNKYSRGHTWEFDGGVVVPASSSPHVVPLPLSVEENVDPEEAFIAAISSCHMLTFLGIAAKRRYVIDSYTDHAIGLMEDDAQGYTSVTKVTLRPDITFIGDKQPTYEQLEKMHHLAHQHCFIANSVKTEITTEIRG